MRQIKFRAWNQSKAVEKMLNWDFLKGIEVHDVFDRDNLVLMQYIGLKDKNGVEIFEGDVLSHYDKHYVVKWDVHMAASQTENIKDSVDSDFFNWGNTPSLVTKDIPDMGFGYSTPTCEVIGNIYEHPDLLSA